MTYEDFIKKANAKFNSIYQYREETFTDMNTEMTIICPIHGEIKMTPKQHLGSKYGCFECSLDSKNRSAQSRTKWNEDTVCEESKKYKTKKEFQQGSSTAYGIASKNGWLETYIWIKGEHKSCNYWTHDRVMEEAHLYDCTRDFRAKSPSAYVIAKSKKWLKDITWFHTPPKINVNPLDKIWSVYTYFLPDNSVYPGLTRVGNSRHIGHNNKSKNDILLQRCTSLGIKIPKPKIEKVGLNAEEAQYFEDFYKKKYESEGYEVLNIAPTGVGIGSLGGDVITWTKEACIEESRKYRNMLDFQALACGAYNATIRNGWIKSFTWLDQEYKKEIYKFSLEGKFIEKFDTLKAAVASLGFTGTDWLGKCARGKKEYHGFYWRFRVDVDFSESGEVLNIDPSDKTPSKSKKNSSTHYIVQYTIDGDFIKEFINFKEASLSLGLSSKVSTPIRRSCLFKNIREAYGYLWRFREDVLDPQTGEPMKHIEI